MATNPNVEEKKAVEDILHSKGVSSVAQKDKTPFQKFLSSSIAFVIALEVLLILIFGLTAQPGTFLTVSNMMNILMNSAQMIILAVGLTYVISSGYFDLSVGMNLILCSVVAAKVFKLVAGTPAEISQGLYPHMALGVIATIITAIVIGMAGGALNAFATSKLKLIPFIATLSTMYILQGIAMVICNGAQEKLLPRAFQTYFGHAKLFGVVPYQVIVAIVIGICLHLIMKYTRFGLHVRAMGSNCESARRAGIKIVSNSFRIYLMMGALAGVAGIFDITRFATTNPSGHTTDGMMAIMAVVMGGTSMKGGIASVCGSMLAVLIPVTLQIGMIVLGINSFYQLIAIGIFLVIAVYVDYVRNIKTGK